MSAAEQVSRRGFFRRAAGATAAGAVTRQAPQPPLRAWIIMALHWQYNDEFSFEEGESADDRLFFDQEQADDACKKLCDEFFTSSPQEFEPCWPAYDVDPDTATWDDLRSAGFPDPFYVKELST
ncbi:MAG: hypothetical protein HY290_23705 [Planctomycetia bacterium]|nr:hypothetical protein [Planctomycetia bacterium]